MVDVLDGGGGGLVVVASARKIAAGDLEAVEEEAGALGVEVVGGDAGEDVEEGELDVGAGVDLLELEVVAARIAALACGAGEAEAALAVVEAEVAAADGGRAAALAGGVDVAAEIAALRVALAEFRVGIVGLEFLWHGVAPRRIDG